MSKSRSGVEKQAQGIAQQQQQAGQGNINQGVGMESGAVTNPTASPLYKSLYNTESSQLSDSYQNAAANTRARANAAGFGYEQPVTQGAEAQLGGQMAEQQGQLPGKVMSETVPLEMQAGRDVAQTGLGEMGAGNQFWTGSVTPLEQQYMAQPSPWESIAGGFISPFASAFSKGAGQGLWDTLSNA